jgi:hypothetical protein
VAKPQVEGAHLALAAADPVARSEFSGESGGGSELAGPAANTSAPAAADSGALPWPALIVCGLILLIAGGRLLFGPIEPESFRYSRFRFIRRAFPRA